MLKFLSWEGCAKEKVQEAENLIGKKFPEDYSEFLTKYDGAIVDPSNFIQLKNGQTRVHELLKTGKLAEWRGFSKMEKTDLLPIGYDDFGNQFCIDIGEGVYRGFVYFNNHETGELELLAKSFFEFIKNTPSSK